MLKAGIIEQTKKCLWGVHTVSVWLGIEVDVKLKHLVVPEKKKSDIMEALQQCLNKDKVSSRELAKISGLIMSLLIVK